MEIAIDGVCLVRSVIRFFSPYLNLDYSHYTGMPYACDYQASSTTNAVNSNHLLGKISERKEKHYYISNLSSFLRTIVIYKLYIRS